MLESWRGDVFPDGEHSRDSVVHEWNTLEGLREAIKLDRAGHDGVGGFEVFSGCLGLLDLEVAFVDPLGKEIKDFRINIRELNDVRGGIDGELRLEMWELFPKDALVNRTGVLLTVLRPCMDGDDFVSEVPDPLLSGW